MKIDQPPPAQQPNYDSGSNPTPPSTPSHDLARTTSVSPEIMDRSNNSEVLNIMQVLLERGEDVAPGTQVIESPFGDGMHYDVTRFFGVETRLPEGDARYTIRAWRRTVSDAELSERNQRREQFGLSPQSREDVLDEQDAAGILVVSSVTDEVDGKPRKTERVLGYIHPKDGAQSMTEANSGVVDPDIPESLISPYVTPTKLSGNPMTLEDARSEGDVTRKELFGEVSNETGIMRVLGKIGVRRRSDNKR